VRSDGAQVATSYCGHSGSPTTESQSCTLTLNNDWCTAMAPTEGNRPHAYYVNYSNGSSYAGDVIPRSTSAGAADYDRPAWQYTLENGRGRCAIFRQAAGDACDYMVNPSTGATSDHRCYNWQVGP
jgi:hypothetical protein